MLAEWRTEHDRWSRDLSDRLRLLELNSMTPEQRLALSKLTARTVREDLREELQSARISRVTASLGWAVAIVSTTAALITTLLALGIIGKL